jgi:hypothetical protein
MNKQTFHDAYESIISSERERAGIGTLSEKTLHAVLKRYFAPNAGDREVKIGRYVADIVGENGIIEIQTQGFDKLRGKLAAFLDCARVTVVYPIAATKWLCWIDGETGVVTKKRRSPKTGTVYDAFFELYKIKQLLGHPNLTICLVLLEIEEYRNLDGWSRDKKKGSSRCERLPIDIIDEVYLKNTRDYINLMPESSPKPFTTKDFSKAAKMNLSSAQLALNVLYHIGAVTRTGKRGNLNLYETSENELPISGFMNERVTQENDRIEE